MSTADNKTSHNICIGGTHNPRIFVVELNRPNVVQVPQQREKAAAQLVVPYLDFVIISARDNERLNLVKINTTNRAIMLVKSLE